MFETKPASVTLEFTELRRVFTPGQLALAFDRHPETVTRWAKRVPHTVESVVDRFWYVMHVAVAQADWEPDDARWFLLSIQPRLGGRVPAELVRRGDLDSVVEVIEERRATGQEQTEDTPANPFTRLMAPEPTSSQEIFGRRLTAPDTRGRVRPLGGQDEDAFQMRLTAEKALVIGAGSLED
jgi:hypothetical protein